MKCIVMLSGGLDSRLVVKIMQEKGYDVLAVHFNLPFGSGCCDEKCSFNFSQMQGVKLKVFDCSRGKLLQDYLEVLKDAKHGRGAGVNPCIDCRLFMLKKVKEFADAEGIEIIATGEVEGQRPMSQQVKQMKLIEEESGLGERLVRPLTEDYGITGRRRSEQMKLAEKFGIDYPSSGGGCLLCEKNLKNRLKYLLGRGLDENEIRLVGLGRHFVIDGKWVVLGRNEKENNLLESIGVGELLISSNPGPSALILNKDSEKGRKVFQSEEFLDKVNKLMLAYSDKDLNKRKKFENFRL